MKTFLLLKDIMNSMKEQSFTKHLNSDIFELIYLGIWWENIKEIKRPESFRRRD